MAEVSVRDLKNRLSEHLRRLEENGESITVTRRGKPVAVMTPAEPRESDARRRMWRLVEEGVVKWSGGKPEVRGPGVKLRGAGPTAAEIVIQGRD
jgi:prevent-host-death family protein